MTPWFSTLSFRWRLQISFFLVAVVTIVFVRWNGYQQLLQLVEIARQGGVMPDVSAQLDAGLAAYISNALWRSVLELAVLFLVISIMAKRFVAPIESLCKVAKNLGKGDLTQKVTFTANDEIGMLAGSFNTMLGGLKEIVHSVDSTSSQLEQSAYQVATISHEISEVSQSENAVTEGMIQDATVLIEVAESVQQMAREAIERATIANQGAQEGIAYVGDNVAGMDETVADVTHASRQVAELKDAAQQIYEIIGTIRGIAEQTNLLALNAAIEAARAGDSGRGFAVVADEVRDLATRTTDSTSKITDIINKINGQVGQVAESMETVAERVNGSQGRAREAGAVIERIAHDISSVADANQKIDDESKTQLNQLQMLQIRLAGLFESVQQTAVKVENTANVSDDLYRVTESLRQVLSQFTYEKVVQTRQISDEHRVAPRLTHQLRVRFWQSGVQFESICNDLSLSGMKLRIKRELDTKEPIDLEVFLPYEDLAEYEAQRPVALRAEVVWQRRENGKLQCGLHFIDLTPEREKELNRCFEYFNEEAQYA
ncbi:Methyl-accepting chemotaxis protein [hydrothermal vent metagenome]|uniref:Methyl-accepting chemotaxis protein n=1 Tax=hydrothermal vent metagenome TaxID=652676 RepID=A0A3B1AUQ4_9ZZZZ